MRLSCKAQFPLEARLSNNIDYTDVQSGLDIELLFEWRDRNSTINNGRYPEWWTVYQLR